MADARMTAELVELVANHLGCDADEVEFHSADQRPQEITAQWNEWSRDMSHIAREDRQAVLQRIKPWTPRMVGDVAVWLCNDVQTQKGKARVKAAILDFGDRCQIASF